ncbi:hypothetical protein NVV94_10395 [Pseudomonas sp. LS1212]|uniref:hypothetical protein n=1 Tax=Pseudomonas sp. LS1212 TaxID=2972478 RepID=UPI00215C01BC|nr:hypothetical protein [Pseudomonas sp. LS1212]UVJ45912.1 hypothetical protein NVV94_10395 [Pseudomonas sp. LS1212]
MSLSLPRFMVVLLALVLIAGTAQAVTGPETAQLLNRRYNIVAATCAVNNPPYFCNGVLARPVPADHGREFWRHGPEAIGLGAERFAYLRADGITSTLGHKSGYVFADRFTAISQGKDYDVQGDDGASRPDELLVRNWDEQLPARLPLQALFYDVTQVGSLLSAQRDQRDYYRATGEWLPVLRMDLNDGQRNVFGFNQKDQLYVGYQLASRLNARYSDTASTCRDGRAAFYCNGVLIRGAAASPGFHAWNPSPNSVGRNGVSFSYVRADVGTVQLAGVQGFIFTESFAPVSYPATLRCAYPANAGTSGIPNSCRGFCDAENITTVAAWRARYASSPGSSCAFSPGAAQYQLNIDVRAHGGSWNEIILAAWPQNIPTQIPLEAFFYTAGSAALSGAQYIQRDYYQQTGRYLPIVRVTLTAPAGQVFAYDPQDQNI